jgi:hypothetical protein
MRKSAQIRVKKSRTGFFLFDIGLFQGCVLSCILFNCVFQMLLDLIAPLHENGYHFKGTRKEEVESPIILHDQAFADDLSIITSTPELNQRSINVVLKFLAWFHLQANPKKCISMAMKKFNQNGTPIIEYERYGDTVYCPFDPSLEIGGEKLKFIVNVAADPTSLQFDHFKELGRFISVDLSETKIKSEISRRVFSDMEVVEASGVNGLCKLYLYEHFVIRRLSWVFLVHDLSVWFVTDLDKRITPRLKIWAGLYRGSDIGALYRAREHLGLQLTAIEAHYKHLQLVKCCLLQNSSDDTVRAIYNVRKARVTTHENRWSGPKVLENLEPVADHALRFAGQMGTSGLGANRANPYIANPTTEQRRAKITEPLLPNVKKNSCVMPRVSLGREGGLTGTTSSPSIFRGLT